ncbi:hypothetical protein Tco_0108438, partial [Tanacetum coccineum]
SLTALSPGYITDSDPEDDPKEDSEDDPEEDPTDFLADRGDDEEEESFRNDADDEDDEEASEEEDDDDEEEDHLTLTNSSPTLLPYLLMIRSPQLRRQNLSRQTSLRPYHHHLDFAGLGYLSDPKHLWQRLLRHLLLWLMLDVLSCRVNYLIIKF